MWPTGHWQSKAELGSPSDLWGRTACPQNVFPVGGGATVDVLLVVSESFPQARGSLGFPEAPWCVLPSMVVVTGQSRRTLRR